MGFKVKVFDLEVVWQLVRRSEDSRVRPAGTVTELDDLVARVEVLREVAVVVHLGCELLRGAA